LGTTCKEEITQVQLRPHKLEQADRTQDFDKKIKVAVFGGFATGTRSKDPPDLHSIFLS